MPKSMCKTDDIDINIKRRSLNKLYIYIYLNPMDKVMFYSCIKKNDI